MKSISKFALSRCYLLYFLQLATIFSDKDAYGNQSKAQSVLNNVLKFSQYLRLGVLINEVLIKKKKCISLMLLL